MLFSQRVEKAMGVSHGVKGCLSRLRPAAASGSKSSAKDDTGYGERKTARGSRAGNALFPEDTTNQGGAWAALPGGGRRLHPCGWGDLCSSRANGGTAPPIPGAGGRRPPAAGKLGKPFPRYGNGLGRGESLRDR